MVTWTDFLLSWASYVTVPHLNETHLKKNSSAFAYPSATVIRGKRNAWKGESSWNTLKRRSSCFLLGKDKVSIIVSICLSLHQSISCKNHMCTHITNELPHVLSVFSQTDFRDQHTVSHALVFILEIKISATNHLNPWIKCKSLKPVN